jgi:protein-tyrosine phosphatase
MAVAITSTPAEPMPFPPPEPEIPTDSLLASPLSGDRGGGSCGATTATDHGRAIGSNSSSGSTSARVYSVIEEHRYQIRRERLFETLGVRADARALVRVLARGTQPEDGSWVAPSGVTLSSETVSAVREWARGGATGPWTADVAYGRGQKINRIPTSASSGPGRLYLGRIDTLTGTPALWVRAEGLAALTVVDNARLASDGIDYESLRPPHSRRVDLVDEPTPQAVQRLISGLPEGVAFIAENLQRSGVAVHCMAGESRSASFVIAFLIVHERMAFDEALSLVRAQRPQVAPNRGFERALRSLETFVSRAADRDRIMALSDFARSTHVVGTHIEADESEVASAAVADSAWSWVLLPRNQTAVHEA